MSEKTTVVEKTSAADDGLRRQFAEMQARMGSLEEYARQADKDNAALKDSLAARDSHIDALVAGRAQVLPAGRADGLLARKHNTRKSQRTRSDVERLRQEIKDAALTEDGHKKYVIPTPFYRLGDWFPAGSTVKLPVEEDPSVTWEPVTEPTKKGKAPRVVEVDDRLALSEIQKGKGKRSADQTVG